MDLYINIIHENNVMGDNDARKRNKKWKLIDDDGEVILSKTC